MKSLRNNLRLVAMYFRVNLASALEYRASFWLQAFGMMLSNLSFVFFWWIAFERMQGPIGSYDFPDVMYIWALSSSSLGLAWIIFGNQTQLTRLIVQGELDVFLMQPKPLLLNVLCARTSLTAWGDLVYGFVLFAIVQRPDLAGWANFVFFLLNAALLCTAVVVTAHACTFYLGSNSIVGSMAQDFLLNFCIYPIGIYKGIIRVLIFTLVPAGFIVHIPLSLLHEFNLWKTLGTLAFTGLYCVLAWAFWNRGLRRYASGNLITTSM